MDTIKINAGNVKMIAHRGLSGIERENTCPAFVAAGNRSYFGVETDVHETADGEFVIIHDETTKRVSLGAVDIDVEASQYAQLKDIVLPDLDGSTNRQDIRIPLLIDYISICKKYGKVCVLELKNAFPVESIARIVALIEKAQYLSQMIFISFDLNNCVTLRTHLPDAKIQWLISGAVTEEVLATLLEYKLDLDIYYRSLTKSSVEKLHANGIVVNCWTCDKPEDAQALIDMGVDYITSNILE